ncbi:hypothetical protein PCANC_28644 [Puccinia coronata f. sp. avenae]|uniref:CxC1-like cysteine cluster associated with KDZ transposases domain-containing protein n=1 Tax=Puccinia coronata f. sp. avenae TaxID=200324 RepID=A0A2N5TE64_9BASI|nr:hypothetical protein PCANC_28644 [Puccinia coronata f. sp. avenae]
MGSCCRHDSVIYLANIHCTGKNRALPLSIIKRLLENIDSDWPVGVLYDLGCSLDKYINARHIFPKNCLCLKFGTLVFHAYVHEWPCQVLYNPWYQKGWALSDGESLERLWSSLSPQRGILNLASWLRKKFEQALTRRNTEIKVISSLSRLQNPHGDGKYTVKFFCSQWDDQVRVALQKKNKQDQNSKLADFLLNEELIESYRERILKGKWAKGLFNMNKLFDVIRDKHESQKKMTASMGRDCNELCALRKSELGLLTLL